MSKSVGNVLSPQDLIKEYGADVVRLWVAAVDFRDDMPISKEIMTRTADAYRKVRNTLRFLLSNLGGFDPVTDAVPAEQLRPVDAYFLRRGRQLAARVERAYEGYEFHLVYRALNNFCAVDLSAVYLDILKDRLYCSHPNAAERRSAQTVLWRLARMLATVAAPVLTFTADEAWEHLPGSSGSVHLETFERITDIPDDVEADTRFARLLELRDEVNKQLEIHRQSGSFGKSLEAALLLRGDRAALREDLLATGATLEELCIVSQVVDSEESDEAWPTSLAYPRLSFTVRRAAGTTCPRCWQVCAEPPRDPRHPDLCPRCLAVVLDLEREKGA
jgi:isoleucyl-tRNA synthetase